MSESRTPATVNNITATPDTGPGVRAASARKITSPNGPVAEIIGRKMAAALDPNLQPQPKPAPLGELSDRYKPVSDREYMTRARSRQGYGAARTESERFMDWRTWDQNGDERTEANDWKNYAPSKTHAYPASRFRYEDTVGQIRELRCGACGEQFTAKRRDAVYCGAACRKWRERNPRR